MAEDGDIFTEEIDSFRKYSTEVSRLVYRDSAEFTDRLSFLLDKLNAREYSLKIAREQAVSQLLIQCCHIVEPSNEELLVKFCQLITNSVSRQQMVLETGIDKVTDYVLSTVKCTSPSVVPEVLWSLSALLYENCGRLSKFHEGLVGSNGMLLQLSESGDYEIRRTALQCLENICIRTPGGVYLSEPHQQNCLLTFLKVLHSPKPPAMEDVAHCRVLVSCLRGIQNILLTTKSLTSDHLGPLLAALKVYSVYGLPGHVSVVPDTLYPTPLSHYDPNPPPATKPVVENTANSSTPKGQGKKGKKKKPTRARQREEDGVGDNVNTTENSAGLRASGLASNSTGNDIPSLFPSWSRVSSSESEFSDTEGGQASKLKSYCSKVRQCTFACFYSVIKAADRRVMFGYWNSFLPDSPGMGGISRGQTLFTTIMKDPSPKVRTGALAVLTALLEGSKHYLMAAEDGEAQRAAFTPFSVTLGYIAKELHRCLLLSLVSENSPLAITQIIKSLAALVPNVPYQRLKPGLLTRIVKQIKPFLNHRDPNIRVACLTCLGSVVSVQAPLLEVHYILQSGSNYNHHGNQQMSVTAVPPSTNLPSAVTTDNTNSESGYHSNQSDIGSVNSPDGLSSPNVSTPGSSSGLQTPTFSEQLLRSTPTEASWVVRMCVKNVCASLLESHASGEHEHVSRGRSENIQPLPVRLESLQLLAQLSKCYFSLVRPCLSLVQDLIRYCLEDKDHSVQLHGAKLLEEVGAIMLQLLQEPPSSSTPLELSQVQKFWIHLLSGPLPGLMQNSGHQAVRATACDCLANIGPQVFDRLTLDMRVLCITLLLGITSDEDHHVRAAAIRALGVYVLYQCLRDDVCFVADVANAILTSLNESNLNVKIKAAWALGNLSDALVLNKDCGDHAFMEDFSDMLLLKLFEMATKGSQDNDKVKSNGVRALGNLLRYLPFRSFNNSRFSHTIENGIQALIKNVSTGTMKVRWNACYATSNMFKNELLPIGTAPWSVQMYHSLSAVVRDCKNFKVRINAAMAFSIPNLRKHFGDIELYRSIVDSLVAGLLAAETVSDFAEFRYRDNLTEQVCGTLVHLIGLVEMADLIAVQQVVGPHYEVLLTYTDRYKYLLKAKQVPAHKDRVDVWKKTQEHLNELTTAGFQPDEQTALTIIMDIFEFTQQLGQQRSPGAENLPQSAFRQTYD